MTKMQKNNTQNGNICVLCYIFWANYNLDLFSISKWPSDTQFCERYNVDGQKMARNGCKTAICQSEYTVQSNFSSPCIELSRMRNCWRTTVSLCELTFTLWRTWWCIHTLSKLNQNLMFAFSARWRPITSSIHVSMRICSTMSAIKTVAMSSCLRLLVRTLGKSILARLNKK